MANRCRPLSTFTVDPKVRAAVRVRAERTGESQSAIVERGMALALAGRVLAFHGPTCPGCGAASGTADSPASAVAPALAEGHLRCCAGCGVPDWPAGEDEMLHARAADEAWELMTAWPGDTTHEAMSEAMNEGDSDHE